MRIVARVLECHSDPGLDPREESVFLGKFTRCKSRFFVAEFTLERSEGLLRMAESFGNTRMLYERLI